MADVWQVDLGGEDLIEVSGEGIESYEDAVRVAMGGSLPEPQEQLPELFNRNPGQEVNIPQTARLAPSNPSVTEQLRSGLSLATTDEESVAVLQRFIPDAEIELLPTGEVKASGVMPDTGEEFNGVLNREGLSGRDIDQGKNLALMFAPGGAAASSVRTVGPVGVASRVGIAMASEGITEAARQYLVRELADTDIPFSATGIALAAGGAGGGELAGTAVSWLSRQIRNPFYYQSGKLTKRGRELFEEVGIDPSLVDANPDIMDKFKVTPGMPSTARDAGLLQSRPDLLVQTQATGIARPSIESVERASRQIRRDAAISQGSVTSAYDAAKMSNASFSLDALEESIERTKVKLAQDAYPITTGQPRTLLRDLERNVLKGTDMGEIGPANLNGYEIWRKKASGAARALSKNPEKAQEEAAVRAMIRNMDDEVLGMFRRGVIEGDPTAIEVWNFAISRAAEHAKKFTPSHIVRTVSEDKLLPDEVAALLFRTRGKITERAEAIKALRNISTEESWNEFKSEYLSNILRQGQQDGLFDPVTFSKNWGKLKRQEPSVIQSFLDPTEMEIMDDLARFTPRGGKVALLRAVSDLISLRYGVQGNAIAGSFRRTAHRLSGFNTAQRPMLATISSTAGATAGAVTEDDVLDAVQSAFTE